MWKSELDGLFQAKAGSSNSHLEVISTYGNNTGQFGVQHTTLLPPVEETPHYPPMSPEFINYMVALLIYSLRYAAVFWYTKMAFSTIFSFVLMISAVHFVFTYNGIGVLYKFQANINAVEGLDLMLPASVTMVLYLIACAVAYFSTIAVFNYGYGHFIEKWKQFLISHFPLLMRTINTGGTTGCQGYIPHFLATICLVIVVGLRAPIVYDYVMLYRKIGLDLILVCIILDALYLFVWVVVWFAFTIKQKWDFKILLSKQMEKEIADKQPSVYTVHTDTLRTVNNTQRQEENVRASPVPVSGSQAPVASHKKETSKAPGSPKSGSHSKGSSGKRQNHQPHQPQQQVAFDKDVKQKNRPVEPVVEDLNKNDNRPQKPPRKPEADDIGARNRNNHPDKAKTDIVVKRVKSDSVQRSRDRGETLDDSTMDSTLTRSYRHSLRDACGQYYYRNPEDIMEEPEVEPSPRGPSKGYFGDIPLEELDFPPLQPHRSLPNMNEDQLDDYCPYNSQPYQYAPAPVPHRHSMQLPPSLHINPHKPSREVDMPPPYVKKPRRGEIMIDQPPAYHPRPPKDQYPPPHHRHSRDVTGNQIPEAAASSSGRRAPPPRPVDNKPHQGVNKRIDFSGPEPRTTDTISKPNQILPPLQRDPPTAVSSSQRIPLSSNARTISQSQPRLDIGTKAASSSIDPMSHSTLPHRRINDTSSTATYQNLPSISAKPPEVPPRTGRNKPDLNRRDSALPSSTDTSSNESHENVLCSQV